MSPTSTRQTFVQEILTQIHPGQVGLALIDQEAIQDVIINSQGQVLCFAAARDETSATAQDTGRPTTLDSLTITDLALVLDSFGDPDFGGVTPIASLKGNRQALPLHFQDRFGRNEALADVVQQQLGQ